MVKAGYRVHDLCALEVDELRSDIAMDQEELTVPVSNIVYLARR